MSEESTVETTGAEVTESEELEAAGVSGEEEEAQTSGEEETEETNSQEAEEGSEGEEEEAPRKLTAEERKAQLQQEIQSLANKRRELREALSAEVEETVKRTMQQSEQEKPPFVDVNWEVVNAHVAAEMDAIEDLKAEGKAAQALFKQRALDKLCAEIEENEAKRQQWQSEQAEKRQQATKAEYTSKALQEAAEVVRKSKGVSEENWRLMEQWFDEKCKTDDLLALQFREKLENQGPAHANIWKHDYMTKTLGKEAKQSREAKEDGKGKQLSGNPSTGKDGYEGVKTFADLQKLPGSKQAEFAKKHPKVFQKILDSKMQNAL